MVITGIIRPPPDIRVVADRTAEYVAKNGRGFESRILSSAKGKTPKFAFLQPTSPFHAYYEDKIKSFQNPVEEVDDENKKDDGNKGVKSSETKSSAADTNKDKNKKSDDTASTSAGSTSKRTKDVKQKASLIDPIAKAILGQRTKITDHLKKEREKRRKAASPKETADGDNNNNNNNSTTEKDSPEQQSAPENNNNNNYNKFLPLPPPPLPLETVHVVAPYNLTPTQIETIQLVAQFVAMDGKGGPFLPALCSREWSNPTFGFCQPRNIHFAYFSALVDAYRKIIHDYTSADIMVATIQNRDGSAADETTTVKIKTKEEEEKKQSPQAPTVVYDAQAALDDAAYRTEYERELERRRLKQQQQHANVMEDGEIANVIDWHDFVVVETIDFPIEEQVDVELSMLPTKTATTTASTASGMVTDNDGGAASASADNDMEESSDDDDGDDDAGEETIRVVPSYTPKVVGTFDPSTSRAIDPITGKSVSVADMPEHMRIQLLDPKWAEERKKFQDKQKDSNLVGGDAIVANMARFSGGNDIDNNSNNATSGVANGATTTQMSTPSVAAAITTAPRMKRPPPPPPPFGATATATNTTPVGFPGASAGTGPAINTAGEPSMKKLRTNASDPRLGPLPSQPQHKVTIAPVPPSTSTLSGSNIGTNNNNSNATPSSVTDSSPTIGNPTTTTDATQGITDTTAIDTTEPAEEKKLLPANEFIASLDEPVVELQVRVPNDQAQQSWNFFGQTLTLTSVDVTSKVKDVKDILSKSHLNGMPPNKIQLKDPNGGFLSNNATLATLNIGPTAILELKTKQRGGRK